MPNHRRVLVALLATIVGTTLQAQELADTAWRDYAGRNTACAALLKLARDVPA